MCKRQTASKAYRTFLLIRLVLSGMLVTAVFTVTPGCSRQAPPSPAPKQKTTTTTTQPPAPAPAEPKPAKDKFTRGERTRGIAENKFKLYERKIKVADFPRAEAAMRDLRAVFDLEGDYKAFWEKSLPPTKRALLTLMSLCEVCKDGKCPVCKGESKCEACKGTGKCPTCDGRPIRYQACRACICRACAGAGKCGNCSGFKSKKCQACSGYGTVSGNSTTECRRCGGTGYINGLKGPSGVSRLKCLTCKGRGKLPSRVLNTCTVCSGRGRIPCSQCGGKGRCASCSGSGRTSSCSVCGGTGRTMHKCPQCNGDGKCISCEGSGHCNHCQGSGKCFECDGGVVRIYDFPIHSDWLTMKEGYVLFDSRLRKIVAQDEKAGFKEIKYKDLRLSVVVNPGQIIFIATQPAFDPVIKLIQK